MDTWIFAILASQEHSRVMFKRMVNVSVFFFLPSYWWPWPKLERSGKSHILKKTSNNWKCMRLEQTEDWWRDVGGGSARWGMGTKEGTCCDEHWVLFVSDESLNSIPETNIALYVN